ncbi:hypothetical protein ACFE04_029058 [Oxalis oulophora]
MEDKMLSGERQDLIYIKKGLAKDVLEVVKEDDLLNADTILFQNTAKWKVHSSDSFIKSFKQLESLRTKKNILNLLLKLSTGWRPKKRSNMHDSVSGSILNKFKVDNLFIVCSIDIIKDINYTQVLKAWDVLPLEDIPELEKRLEAIFRKYTHDYMNRVEEKCFHGNLEVPKTWSNTIEIVRFRDVSSSNEMRGDFGGSSYVENSKVSESLSLMKFYTLSSGMVSHLLSDCELELPFEVTEQERDIIAFPGSTFILGRSGTGKTTVLTRKLCKKEEELCGDECNSIKRAVPKDQILRQLFVTVSPQLCHAIKRHIADLKRSVAFQSFLRTKEVTYERFNAIYWPHFNTQIRKMIDCSTVFTEIMSQIKGGLQSIEASDGKLSQDNYLQLSDSRVSSLSRQKREMVFEIYLDYERKKMENGEFDLADLVIDLHARLKALKYKGDLMDYVYIDEVQDLTMSQIALFKYICKNADEGFVFSGDTAQTIARGINFRFQDIRSLFYTKFMMECTQEHNVRKEKGHMSPIFNLTQNFRTHTGVLNVSQSIIDLLYHFFPNSIDVLKPEKSLIYGEPPILLESGNGDGAIITIFGDNGNDGDKIVGFGAEQVILVRDDSVKLEISKQVGQKALILTILECKGLEFQDVLLYNFFGSSPLKNKWRVIYTYMKEQGLVDQLKEQTFQEDKHNMLCSELKQLYVGITRTCQRLWICENNDVISKPMFDYWKTKSLVQVRQLDDSLAKAMQVESSPEEWRLRGIKLFSQNNYEMATMCFERAGDSYWERMAKAACLQVNAEHVRHSNPEEANAIMREAAELYDSIGKADSAAQCFFDLGDYKRAGEIYMEKCGEVEKAEECFYRAGLYEAARHNANVAKVASEVVSESTTSAVVTKQTKTKRKKTNKNKKKEPGKKYKSHILIFVYGLFVKSEVCVVEGITEVTSTLKKAHISESENPAVPMDSAWFWDIFETAASTKVPITKEDVNLRVTIFLLAADAASVFKPKSDLACEWNDMHEDLKMISFALKRRAPVASLCERLISRRQKIEPLLHKTLSQPCMATRIKNLMKMKRTTALCSEEEAGEAEQISDEEKALLGKMVNFYKEGLRSNVCLLMQLIGNDCVPVNDSWFWEFFETLQVASSVASQGKLEISSLPITCKDMNGRLDIVCMANAVCSILKEYNLDRRNLLRELDHMLEELRMISVSLEKKEPIVSSGLCKVLLSRRPVVSPFLQKILSERFTEATGITMLHNHQDGSRKVDTIAKPEAKNKGKEKQNQQKKDISSSSQNAQSISVELTHSDGHGKKKPTENSAFRSGSSSSNVVKDEAWFWNIFEAISKSVRKKKVSNLQLTKEDVDERLLIIHLAMTSCSMMEECKVIPGGLTCILKDIHENLKMIHSALVLKVPAKAVIKLCETLLSRRKPVSELLSSVLPLPLEDDDSGSQLEKGKKKLKKKKGPLRLDQEECNLLFPDGEFV